MFLRFVLPNLKELTEGHPCSDRFVLPNIFEISIQLFAVRYQDGVPVGVTFFASKIAFRCFANAGGIFGFWLDVFSEETACCPC